jgi:hypothetical protein
MWRLRNRWQRLSQIQKCLSRGSGGSSKKGEVVSNLEAAPYDNEHVALNSKGSAALKRQPDDFSRAGNPADPEWSVRATALTRTASLIPAAPKEIDRGLSGLFRTLTDLSAPGVNSQSAGPTDRFGSVGYVNRARAVWGLNRTPSTAAGLASGRRNTSMPSAAAS